MNNHEKLIELKKAQYMSELNDLKLDLATLKQKTQFSIKDVIFKFAPFALGALAILRGDRRISSLAVKYVKYNLFPKYFSKFVKPNMFSKFFQKSFEYEHK